jgi:hypothetical protein
MTDTSIIDNNVNEVDVLSEYFEVVDKDVYYTFKGIKCGGMNRSNLMYGKTVEMNGLYLQMLGDVKLFFESGIRSYNGGNGNVTYTKRSYNGGNRIKVSLLEILKKITFKKYGVTINKVWRILNGGVMCMDDLYKDLIKLYGINGVDWMVLYNNMNAFYTNNNDVILYIANNILKDSIYDYFVKSIGLKIGGIDKMTRIKHNNHCTFVKLEWDRGFRYVGLGNLMRNKRDWYNNATRRADRNDIHDYDVFLNGRNENEMLPERCPVDNNIILNYTAIDFSDNEDNNIKVCKNNNVYNNETWSPASIDRIDSTHPYSYDNIEIISSYYNTQVKNCASHSQIGKLYYYQLMKLLNKKISKELVKSMSDDELYKVSDMFSVYFKLFEIVSDNSTILHKEMVRRDKKSKLVVKI